MAYFVAKELRMRPRDILFGWTCEELLVAYGEYANLKSVESYNQRMAFFDKSKPVKPKLEEKWAVIFISREELREMNEEAKNTNTKKQVDYDALAKSLLSID